MMKGLIGYLKTILDFARERRGHLSFELLFKRFREVLESNNRALEIITDMGEKLGGDYLFDITYVKRTYSELFAAIYNSIQNFDVLTRNRYPRLHDVFDNIDSQIRGVIYNAPTSGEMILFYGGISWDRYRDVGGKNAHLAELKNHLKLSVPDAFAITTRAFDEFLKHNRLDERITALGDEDITESKLRELRYSIINGEIPPALDTALESAIRKIKTKCGENCFLALRSSAEEEDGEFSFAGQFETLLNVPLEVKAVEEAYREVVASLFSVKAASYQRQLGYTFGRLRMAVACMVMVDAMTSGVIYSSNPEGDTGTLIVQATWGLGKSVVEGQTDADLYVVKKGPNPEIISKRIGEKNSMIVSLAEGGSRTIKTPDDRRELSCLSTGQITELARQAILIEQHFRKPQDIEWAIGGNGGIFILQARPLKIQERTGAHSEPLIQVIESNRILIKESGTVVQNGVGAGRVFILRHMDELDNFPKGAVLVARHDSSNFVRIMPYASAIITDVGTPTSHMASLCREFRVPTVVNAGNATRLLEHGQEITVSADNGAVTVYEGIVGKLLEYAKANLMKMENLYEYRKKRYVLRYISPLNLIDPLMEEFTPGGCKTMHDILRFIHEKSVAELIDSARYGNAMLKRHAAVKLDLPIPTGIMVIDIGGGLNIAGNHGNATFEQITSVPLRAIIKGMMHPGVWQSEAVSLKVNDFLSSMMRMPDITSETVEYAGYNVAIASGEYVNLSLRFGYHFNMIDCYCSENTRNNHIYFRFVGGATDITKRSRRIQLIADILKEYGFNINTKGDLIIARLANLRKGDLEDILDQLGRLIAYTRQLDAVLHDDNAVERYTRTFLAGKYDL